jgi:alanine dehydrogenase
VVHYGVANMPGAVPHTSTFALVNQTVPFVMKLAGMGLGALHKDPALALGLNCYDGKLTCDAVGEAFDMPVTSLQEVLASL